MQLPNHVLKLLQERLNTVAAMREDLGKPKLKTRGFRYDLEDCVKLYHPERVAAHLIPMSVAAEENLPGRGRWRDHQNAGLRFEHAVPLGVLFEILMEVRQSLTAINETLDRLYHIAWVTIEEDKALNAIGLNRKMPFGWNPDMSPWARYEAAGIPFSDLARPTTS